MKERFDEIDIVKGLAMLTVLFNHSFILFPINIHDRWWSVWIQDINSTFFIGSFFLVSGYLFNSSSRPQRPDMSLLVKKLKRLIIPYLSCSVLNYLVKLIAPSLVNKQVGSVGDYMMDVLLYGGEMWFLYVLFIIFLIGMVVLPYLSKKIIGFITLILFIYDLYIDGIYAEGIFMWPQVIHYSVFFLCGFMLREIPEFRDFIKNPKSLMASSVLFLLCCIILINHIQKFVLGWPILCVIGCWFVWSLSSWLTRYDVAVNCLGYVGKNSLGYYWLNGYVLVLARSFVVSILDINSGPVVVMSIFLMCAIVETLMIIIIKKMPKVGILIGV